MIIRNWEQGLLVGVEYVMYQADLVLHLASKMLALRLRYANTLHLLPHFSCATARHSRDPVSASTTAWLSTVSRTNPASSIIWKSLYAA